MKFLITGGAGFIGSALIRHLINTTTDTVINVDSLTYAGGLDSVDSVADNSRYRFFHTDICNEAAMAEVFATQQPDIVVHLAAESHVDRSLACAKRFVHSNVMGTQTLLTTATDYWQGLDAERRDQFRFHHISTDEVYGDIPLTQSAVSENARYAPSSPYAASKAASDHLVNAWQRSYGLPTLISHSTNNYGPYHHPEKFIPRLIVQALQGQALPIYGDGQQRRDWLHVSDHVNALLSVATHGTIGKRYNIGSGSETTNLALAEQLCALLEELAPAQKKRCLKAYRDLITFVEDRPGHDRRYAVDTSKIKHELAWQPQETLESGLRKTVIWYLENPNWWENIVSRDCGPARY